MCTDGRTDGAMWVGFRRIAVTAVKVSGMTKWTKGLRLVLRASLGPQRLGRSVGRSLCLLVGLFVCWSVCGLFDWLVGSSLSILSRVNICCKMRLEGFRNNRGVQAICMVVFLNG